LASSSCKISSKSTHRFESSTHLRSLNVRHFGMVEAMRLNSVVYVILNAITTIQNFVQNPQSVQNLRVPQKFKRPPFRNSSSYEIKNVISRRPWMAAPDYQISWKSTDRFKSY
jgi:hypothetical protein